MAIDEIVSVELRQYSADDYGEFYFICFFALVVIEFDEIKGVSLMKFFSD